MNEMKERVCLVIFIICFALYESLNLYFKHKEKEMYYNTLKQSTAFYEKTLELIEIQKDKNMYYTTRNEKE